MGQGPHPALRCSDGGVRGVCNGYTTKDTTREKSPISAPAQGRISRMPEYRVDPGGGRDGQDGRARSREEFISIYNGSTDEWDEAEPAEKYAYWVKGTNELQEGHYTSGGEVVHYDTPSTANVPSTIEQHSPAIQQSMRNTKLLTRALKYAKDAGWEEVYTALDELQGNEDAPDSKFLPLLTDAFLLKKKSPPAFLLTWREYFFGVAFKDVA